jgi:hypothetical protein
MTDPRAIAAPYEEIAARHAAAVSRIDAEFQAEQDDLRYQWERQQARLAEPGEAPEPARTASKRVRQQADPSETGYYSAGWLT